MRNRLIQVHLLLAVLALFGAAAMPASATQPLRVSSNGHALVTANGTPFFWMADTNWRLYKLTNSQIDTYLSNRKAKKFNVIQGPVLLHSSDSPEYADSNGEINNNPNDPNMNWFNHIDDIVDKADALGMYVALVAVWGDDWDIFGSPSNAHDYGQWLGQRYRYKDNVVWIVAGEYSASGTDAQIMNTWDALGQGLAEGSNGNQLITIHGSYQEGQQSSSIFFQNASWLDFNMIQSSQSGNFGIGADNWNLVIADYALTPRKPTLDAEANYENVDGWDAFGVRRRAYWSVFAGACGHTYGANSVWNSYRYGDDPTDTGSVDPWNVAMNYPGAYDMKNLRRLIESRPMLKRSPSNSLVVSGTGGLPNHIQAMRGSSGRYAMIYIPQSHFTVTVDMNRISGSQAKAWWYNPRNGAATYIGTYATSGNRHFTTPSGQDWVLVLDDKSKNYPKPGIGGPLP